jgi:hypothetical protein
MRFNCLVRLFTEWLCDGVFICKHHLTVRIFIVGNVKKISESRCVYSPWEESVFRNVMCI